MINGSVRGVGVIAGGKEMAINPGNVLSEIPGEPGKDPALARRRLDRAQRARIRPSRWLYRGGCKHGYRYSFEQRDQKQCR